MSFSNGALISEEVFFYGDALLLNIMLKATTVLYREGVQQEDVQARQIESCAMFCGQSPGSKQNESS